MALSYIIKQKLFARLIEHSDNGVFILDDQFRYVHVNANFAKIINMVPDEILSRPISLYGEKSLSVEAKLLIDEILNSLLLKNYYRGRIDFEVRQGYQLNASISIYAIHGKGDIYYVGKVVEDAGQQGLMQSVDSVNHDAVTQLPFRQYFLVQFGDLILDTIKDVVIVRINFDRFRTLKTNYSSDSVDEVVSDFVQRIYDLNLRDLMLFSRFDEDNFALVFETDDAQLIRNELDKIYQLAERPYIIGKNTIYLHFSTGVSQYPKDGGQPDVLIDNAEKALHYVQENGGDDLCWYHEDLNKASAEKIKLETEVREGLTKEQFFPVYQPKIDLGTNKIVGFEALVRWNHPKLGVQSPAYFIDTLLEHKLSFELFCLMAEQVIQHLYAWQKNGFNQHLCINADTYDFLHPEFTNFMGRMLKYYPVKRGSLHIEVTENSLMQQYDVDVLAQFDELKHMGVQIALDDFGTGYASISYLRNYPFDYIKIDKSFVDDIEEENTQLLIVRAIIDLASALDLYTVAEGIETESQSQVMYDMGCVIGQGYYFGKPVTYSEATTMIITSTSPNNDSDQGDSLSDSTDDSTKSTSSTKTDAAQDNDDSNTNTSDANNDNLFELIMNR